MGTAELRHVSPAETDPFLLLDHVGPFVAGPEEVRGAPWPPHLGFETVGYMLDGEISHHDANGGGGVIRGEALVAVPAHSGG